MTANPAVQRFAEALVDLHRAAGQPSLRSIEAQARMQQPPLRVPLSSLSDWLRGKSLPAKPDAVKFLVHHLQTTAQQGQEGAPSIPMDRWMAMYEQARQQSRAGRPPGPRGITRADLPAGPARDLRDAIYDLYLHAAAPTLDELATEIASNDELPGAPGRDTIHRAISGAALPNQQDAVSIAMALARSAGVDHATTAQHIRELWAAAMTAPATSQHRLGRPIAECDPLALEVHPSLALGDSADEPVLPPYVHRAHDAHLQTIIAEVCTTGANRMVVLVGGSATGKTRAGWEAVQTLPHGWRIWHPFDPTRPTAAAQAIGAVGPLTVIWLNELQHYLLTPDSELGERVAAALRTLLTSPDRGPVLVVSTIWPQHLATLTSPPQATEPDPYAQARELLAASTIVHVPDSFTPIELEAMRVLPDRRLQQAAANADGRISQYLAGAPELAARYRLAPPAARAIIQVAIDARRLGHPVALPHALLEQAAPGYLTDHDWDVLGDDWLEQALAYTARPCYGVRGPLTRLRPRPGTADDGQPHYRLADYLEQVGRTERAAVYPPKSLWTALAATVTDPELSRHLGGEARDRGRYQDAIFLYVQAADHGSVEALRDLAELRAGAGDVVGAEALYRQAADQGDADALRALAELREEAGDHDGAAALASRAADHDSVEALLELVRFRAQAGDVDRAEALARTMTDPGWQAEALVGLAEAAATAGDSDRARALHVDAQRLIQTITDSGRRVQALTSMAAALARAGDVDRANALARHPAGSGEAHTLRRLAELREQAGDLADAAALYQQAVDSGDVDGLRALARLREQAGDLAGADHIRRFGLNGDGSPGDSISSPVGADVPLGRPT